MKSTLRNVFFATILVWAAAACSVKGGAVKNQGPIIEPRAMVYGVQYGRMIAPDSISILMWPTNWTEAETEAKVKIINRASVQITRNYAEANQLSDQIETLWDNFVESECIAKFATEQFKKEVCSSPRPVGHASPATEPTPAPVPPPADCKEEDQVTWREVVKADPGQPGADEYAAYSVCVDNQAKRVAGHNRKLYLAYDNVEHPDFKDDGILVLKMIIDRATGPDTGIDVNTDESSFIFNDPKQSPGAPAVVINLAGFNGVTQKQTSKAAAGDPKGIHDVSLSPNGRRMKFTVPDLKSPFISVSNSYQVQYQFDLSRIGNGYESAQKTKPDGTVVLRKDFAVFKGDILKVMDGVTVRKGSAQIMGILEALAPQN